MSSLHTRLLAGLLVISSLLLVVLSLVSAAVLRVHLSDRLEGQLLAATATASRRVEATDTLTQALTGSTFAVVALNLNTQRTRLVSGDAPQAESVPGLVEGIGLERLTAHASAGRVFELGKDMIAAAARTRIGNRLVIVAVPLDGVEDPVRRLLLAELVTGGLLIALLALLGRLLIVSGLAPLGRMARMALGIARGGDLSARMPEGPSEVGRLGAAINLMLDRISVSFQDRWASEDRVRRFAADASHELRTPLSAVRGYAELYRAGAIPADELPKVMGRIEDEATRMGKLVTEMLELARLDRSAALTLSETDLTAVAREAAADATATDPESPILVDAPSSLVAVVDEARIRQIVVNLLANVRAHTPPGTPAFVHLSRTGDRVLLEIADKGPGMSPEQAARAFDRFHRGEERLSDGAGLGLSIVKAITDAHGGRCWITSTPGEGTTVHIEFPVIRVGATVEAG
ncbi:sensor histidine kinase [Acrocarpospora catenulata]|uniref:sensor histidine kinase n=1 Tax=Acrocarpospora catenulata TaxID=2836182 RepID=UPI001BDB42B6|nr:HAMP domain-containing sensor histidine kinase [Acrocarpospora catenulata]